jgi:hypothetical protein
LVNLSLSQLGTRPLLLPPSQRTRRHSASGKNLHSSPPGCL